MPHAPFATLAAISAALIVATAAPAGGQDTATARQLDEQQLFTANQLDNLVSPIALYPDPLLAQLLIAATFPDQVEEAAGWVRANGTAGIDEQEWDVSVRSLAHYPSALNMMADKPDWMTTLGRAYAFQSADVMAAVQRMRSMAAAHGNLVSTQQHQVVRSGTDYLIEPAQNRIIYVPVYDPVVIYTRPVFTTGFRSSYWSFGVGFPIGGWLTYDCDWTRRVVYYNGWNDVYFVHGGGWRVRSRPFIQITNWYVHPRYGTVYVNHNVRHRVIDYRMVDRYPRIHRDTYFAGRGGRDGRDGRDGWDRGTSRPGDDRTVGTRTAQPRDSRPVATPDGYRRGGSDATAALERTLRPTDIGRSTQPAEIGRSALPRGEPVQQPQRLTPERRVYPTSPGERAVPQPVTPRVATPRSATPQQPQVGQREIVRPAPPVQPQPVQPQPVQRAVPRPSAPQQPQVQQPQVQQRIFPRPVTPQAQPQPQPVQRAAPRPVTPQAQPQPQQPVQRVVPRPTPPQAQPQPQPVQRAVPRPVTPQPQAQPQPVQRAFPRPVPPQAQPQQARPARDVQRTVQPRQQPAPRGGSPST